MQTIGKYLLTRIDSGLIRYKCKQLATILLDTLDSILCIIMYKIQCKQDLEFCNAYVFIRILHVLRICTPYTYIYVYIGMHTIYYNVHMYVCVCMCVCMCVCVCVGVHVSIHMYITRPRPPPAKLVALAYILVLISTHLILSVCLTNRSYSLTYIIYQFIEPVTKLVP